MSNRLPDEPVAPKLASVIIRPSFSAIWPSFSLFPLAGLAVLVFGLAGHDQVMGVIGVGLLAANLGIVLNYAYFTTLAIEGDELVYRTLFGSHVERVPLGAIQRIDAKRYPAAHSGVSAPHFVARGPDTSVRVNTKPYRLAQFVPLIATLRGMNGRVELDSFWLAVSRGEDVSKDIAIARRSPSADRRG